jgi:hypothetical protein
MGQRSERKLPEERDCNLIDGVYLKLGAKGNYHWRICA